MSDSNSNWLLAIFAIAVVVAATWWLLRPAPEQPVVEAEPAPQPAPEPAAPAHPLPAPLPANERGELVELPPLDDSDSYFTLALIDLFGPEIETFLVTNGIIDKIVATVDSLPRAKVAESIRPVGRLATAFAVDSIDDETYAIAASNAARYELLVDMLGATDADTIYATYRRFYPLLQQAYERLGYPDAYFNDRLVEVIDHLLATPVTDEAPLLVRPHVLYQYANPEFEALSAGQKLLLRTGADNAAEIKRVLRELRARIA